MAWTAEDDAEAFEIERQWARRKNPVAYYCPHALHPKQEQFLALTEGEALYGGAAGGAKTDALLAGALQHVNVPGYSALLMRRSFRDLNLPGALMDRSHAWLRSTDAQWSGLDSRWTFPSGATVQFGYCESRGDEERYQSAEFQYVGIDELTEWPEAQYAFLFSRVRRRVGLAVPLRMRAATNPGGLGEEWVRRRFHIPENEIVTEPICQAGRVFLPARAEDNPSLDLVAYEKTLEQLGPDKYQQLRWGRWVRDASTLVYSGFVADLCRVDALPALRAGQRWGSVLGLDFGIRDENAVSLLVWREPIEEPLVYVVFAYRFKGDAPAFAEEVRAIEQRMKPQKIVGDVGGMGKAFDAEFRGRFGIPMQPAQKHNKLGYISLLNGALRSGHLRVLASGCADLIQEWTTLPWAELTVGRKEAPGFDNHAADATLYAWRETQAHQFKPPEPPKTEAQVIRSQMDAYWEKIGRQNAEQNAERWAGLGEYASDLDGGRDPCSDGWSPEL